MSLLYLQILFRKIEGYIKNLKDENQYKLKNNEFRVE